MEVHFAPGDGGVEHEYRDDPLKLQLSFTGCDLPAWLPSASVEKNLSTGDLVPDSEDIWA